MVFSGPPQASRSKLRSYCEPGFPRMESGDTVLISGNLGTPYSFQDQNRYAVSGIASYALFSPRSHPHSVVLQILVRMASQSGSMLSLTLPSVFWVASSNSISVSVCLSEMAEAFSNSVFFAREPSISHASSRVALAFSKTSGA
jgi:hypothetical protein